MDNKLYPIQYNRINPQCLFYPKVWDTPLPLISGGIGRFALINCQTPDLSDTPQEEIRVFSGDIAFIDCVVRNGSLHTVLWKYYENSKSDAKLLSANKVIISDEKRYSVIHNEDMDRWVLQINLTKPTDSGLYVCEVNSVPKQSVTRVLSVSYPKTLQSVLKTNVTVISDDFDHNFTECCAKEGIPSVCNDFCHLKGLLNQTPRAHIFAICYAHMSSIVKCLTDGRNHMPCCERQNIPRICLGSCAGKYSLTTALEHITCLDYATPTLSCIAEGMQILPPPPRDVIVEVTSPSQILVKWEQNPVKSHSLIDNYELNITELHSFDPKTWSLNKSSKYSPPITRSEISENMKKLHKLDNKVNTYIIYTNQTQFTINGLKEATMYEIEMKSINKYGTSVTSNGIRVITESHIPHHSLEKDSKKPISSLKFNKTASFAPNLRKCCSDSGVKSDFCLNTLCDPTNAEEATVGDISFCAQYANITFKCLSPDHDVTNCCEERGVSQFCQHLCSGQLVKTDFRHFICLHYIPAFSSCILESKGLLTSEPRNVVIASKHQDWALIKWSPPLKLSETVLKYHVHIRELDPEIDEGYSVEPTLRSPYLIDGLKPGIKYEIYLTAINKFGMSRGSSRIIFKTKEPESNEDIELQQSDSSVGYNETACCQRAVIPDICLPLCSYHLKINDGLQLGALCADHRTIRTMVRCLAGGRDHRPCCERRGVSNECLDVCIGTINQSPLAIGVKCSKYSGRILQCMVEGADSLPGIPENFHSTLVTKTSIHLQWNASKTDIRSGLKHMTYQIRYSFIDSEIPPHPYDDNYSIRINVSDTKLVLTDLKPDTRYSIYVVAVNPYGYSMPSLVLLVTTQRDNEDERQEIIRSQLGPPHGIQVIQQTTESLSFKWLPPYYIPPDASLIYEVYFKRVTNESSGQQSAWNITDTFANIIDINDLNYNTQYALAVKAKTDTGKKSVLSETVLAWTDPSTPLKLSSPKLEPLGPVIEGEMLTVKCDASGNPIPTISVFVNGVLAKSEETRHLIYKLDYVQRNLTSISCQATNAETLNNNSIFPSQSHLEVRVRFAPTIKINRQPSVAAKYGSAQLKCQYSGNPQPKIQFFRDLRNKSELKSNLNTQIKIIPHSTKSSTWVATVTINRVTESDAGQYICIATNEYGRETAVINLKVESHMSSNRSTYSCCQNEGVPEICLPVCKQEIDFNMLFNRPQCFSELNKFMFCAADGSDHRDCCLRRDVSRDCLHWCAGYKVSKPSLCLLSSVRDILSCFKEGNALLPSMPLNVRVGELLSDNKVVISWEKPAKNSEAVQWYNVYWKRVGSKDLDSDRTDQLGYELHNLDPHQTYEFLVKSSNYYGTSALADPLVINIRQIEMENEDFNRSVLKILLFSIIVMIIMVVMGVIGYYAFKRTNLLNKFRSNDPGFGVSFANQGYVNDSLQMQDNTYRDSNNNERPTVEIRMN
ncbi:Ig-like and fibronectin type-III domain-containing protein 2 [Oppia nitens]|uniref:Ig-like and fibronectin type-III domain-containing protein 2 n=1 Tax=Oppia nitens TaxID=1686743 RepID=UPI0023DBF7D4|nr:Ig-like and fibronectin type-III domain-containing protein 2 [Oppia nitens]